MSLPPEKRSAYRAARKIVVALVGATLVVVGLILVFTPGPAFVVLGLALAVFAGEFAWARRWMLSLKETGSHVAQSLGLREDALDDIDTNEVRNEVQEEEKPERPEQETNRDPSTDPGP